MKLHAVRSDYDRTRTLCGRPGSGQYVKRAGTMVFTHGLRALPVGPFLVTRSEGTCADCRRAIQRQGLERSELARRAVLQQRL